MKVPHYPHEEHLRIVAITIEEAKGKVPVLAGAGGYDTRTVIEMARECEKLGTDGILSVTPYYNKPTQEGLYHHYKAIAEAISIPVILYNVTPRTNVNIDPATVRRLSEIENIIGVKEASGSIAQITQVIQQAPEDFIVLSGDDSLTLPMVAMGGRGIISVASNEIPAEMTSLAKLCLSGDFATARAMHRKYMPLLEVNFIETNPTPVKAAMAEMGLLQPVWRLPLVPRPGLGNRERCHFGLRLSHTLSPGRPSFLPESHCSLFTTRHSLSTTHSPSASHQTPKFPPTTSIHSTSPSHVRMIYTQ